MGVKSNDGSPNLIRQHVRQNQHMLSITVEEALFINGIPDATQTPFLFQPLAIDQPSAYPDRFSIGRRSPAPGVDDRDQKNQRDKAL